MNFFKKKYSITSIVGASFTAIFCFIKFCTPIIDIGTTVAIKRFIEQPHEIELLEKEHGEGRKTDKQQKSREFLKKLTASMAARHSFTRKFFVAIKNKKNIKERQKELQKNVDEWVEHLRSNIGDVSHYFKSKKPYLFNLNTCKKTKKENYECTIEQKEFCKKNTSKEWSIKTEFDCEIHHSFRCIYIRLVDYRDDPNNTDLRDTLGKQIDCLDQRISQFLTYANSIRAD